VNGAWDPWVLGHGTMYPCEGASEVGCFGPRFILRQLDPAARTGLLASLIGPSLQSQLLTHAPTLLQCLAFARHWFPKSNDCFESEMIGSSFGCVTATCAYVRSAAGLSGRQHLLVANSKLGQRLLDQFTSCVKYDRRQGWSKPRCFPQGLAFS
jgi:hypothetical protein